MPTWRKLHTQILDSDGVHNAPDDFTRLLWYNMILVLDSEGRGIYNPAWIRSKAFPCRTDVTIEQVISAMAYLEKAEMIIAYEVGKRKYFYNPNWHKYQNTTREAPSILPDPPNSRPTPDLLQSRSCTEKEKEKEKEKELINQNFYSKFQEILQIPITNSREMDYLNDLKSDYGEEKLMEIAEWYSGLENRNYSTWSALRAIDTAGKKWNKQRPRTAIEALEELNRKLEQEQKEALNGKQE